MRKKMQPSGSSGWRARLLEMALAVLFWRESRARRSPARCVCSFSCVSLPTFALTEADNRRNRRLSELHFRQENRYLIQTLILDVSWFRITKRVNTRVRHIPVGKAALEAFIKMSGSIGKLYRRPFTVCVEGNIGSGKTTFLSHFKKFDNVTVLEEPVELWRDVSGTNLLELMYSEPSRYAFLFQSYVQLTMLQLHTCKTPSPYKIMERSVYSAMCFVENLKRKNVLRDVEVTILEDWYDWCLKSANIETDLIVYLRTTPEIVYERMKQRGRKEENAISLEYLKQIHQIHDDWLYHQTLKPVPSPVITLNGDRELHEMVEEFDKCKNEIFSKVIDDSDINHTMITVSTNRVPEIKAVSD